MVTDDSFVLAREQTEFMRRLGLRPDQALRAIGAAPIPRCGWDDVTWALGAALHRLLIGGEK